MAGDEYVSLTRRGAVARLAMNRPEVHNAFNERLIAQLRQAFETLHGEAEVRVVVLGGEGRSFSAGADLDWMRRAARFSEEENLRDAAAAAALWRLIAEFPRPVIARVHGNAFGGGAGLVAAADIAIAVESALFGFTEVRLGLAPATIAPHVVNKIGPGRALPLFLTGERFEARRAMAIGLVDQVVPDSELDSAVGKTIEMLLEGSTEAHAACKALVRQTSSRDSSIDDYTASLIAALRTSDEGREGVRAFLEKRKPGWAVSPDG